MFETIDVLCIWISGTYSDTLKLRVWWKNSSSALQGLKKLAISQKLAYRQFSP